MINLFLNVMIVARKGMFACFLLCAISIFGQLPGSGNCLDFRRNTEYVQIDQQWNLQNFPFTAMAWIYAEVPPSEPSAPIVSSSNATDGYSGMLVQLVNRPSGWKLDAMLGAGGGWADPNRRGYEVPFSQFNEWCHVAVVFHSMTQFESYINGVKQPGNVVALAQNYHINLTAKPRIGSHYSSPSRQPSFYGSIDEVSIWTIALSQTDIQTYMCKKILAGAAGLEAYYKLDETSGLQVLDSGGAAKHGTFVQTPTRKVSGAAIGNESAFFYPPINGTLINIFGDTLQVDVANASAMGYQIYSVNQSPNHFEGLPNPDCLPERYYGFFPIQNANSINCEFSVKNGTKIVQPSFSRQGNDANIWASAANNAVPYVAVALAKRAEIIAQTPSSQNTVAPKIFIPNIFTPNDDGINDHFYLGIEGGSAALWVFNRWGQEVFYSPNYDGTWSGTHKGKLLAEGVYAYRIDFSPSSSGCSGNILIPEQFFGFVHIQR